MRPEACPDISTGVITLCAACQRGDRAACIGDGVRETMLRRLAAQEVSPCAGCAWCRRFRSQTEAT